MKRCSKCGAEKDPSAFATEKKGRFGVSSRCRACISTLAAARYQQIKSDPARYADLLAQQRELRRRKSSTWQDFERRADMRERGRKICLSCGVEKLASEFWKTNSRCKPCARAANREWCKRNPDNVKQYKSREYARIKSDPERRADFFRASNDRRKKRYAEDPFAAAIMRAKTTLVRSVGVPIKEIPRDLIEAKAAQLLVRRQAANLQLKAERGEN